MPKSELTAWPATLQGRDPFTAPLVAAEVRQQLHDHEMTHHEQALAGDYVEPAVNLRTGEVIPW